MNLRDAMKLKVGGIVDVPYLRIVKGEILTIETVDDPRIKLLVRVHNPGGIDITLNYKHLRKHYER